MLSDEEDEPQLDEVLGYHSRHGEAYGGLALEPLSRIPSILLWNCAVYPITLLRRLQEVRWHHSGNLVLLRPLSDCLEIATYMLRVEVDVRLRLICRNWLKPDLTQDSHIDCAHELLPNDIQTVSWSLCQLRESLAWTDPTH
jgi:hypothetical protein